MAAKIVMVYLMCTCSGQKEPKEKKQTKKKKQKNKINPISVHQQILIRRNWEFAVFPLFPLWELKQSLHYTADTRTFPNKAATDATAFQAATQKHAAAHNCAPEEHPPLPY